MAEQSGGNVPFTCVSCKQPLPTPNARFCAFCGAPQQRMKTCITCGLPLVAGAQHCVCGTDQNNPVCCVNPQCRRKILPTTIRCNYCGTWKLQGTVSTYHMPRSQGEPNTYVQVSRSDGYPPLSGIRTQSCSGVMTTIPHSLGQKGELQVCNIRFCSGGL